MQISDLGSVGAARVDDYVALTPRAGGLHPPEQHWMGPGRIVTGEHHQIGKIEVFITSRH